MKKLLNFRIVFLALFVLVGFTSYDSSSAQYSGGKDKQQAAVKLLSDWPNIADDYSSVIDLAAVKAIPDYEGYQSNEEGGATGYVLVFKGDKIRALKAALKPGVTALNAGTFISLDGTKAAGIGLQGTHSVLILNLFKM
jgi:hypothetical protein